MAFADLGVRILLEDGARSGFDALSMSMFNVFTRTGMLATAWSKLPAPIQAAGLVAGVSGAMFGGLADFLWQTIDAAGQLQQEIANMDVSVNGASQAGNALTDTLINIADQSIYTTAVVADGFTTLGVDGWNAQQLIDGMGAAMIRFAEASRTDVVPAANLLGTVMETYGAQASDATQYTNDLTFALYNGQKTVANMQSAFNQAGATAKGLNVPFGELADTLALLGEDGLKGNMAGSALRYMLTSLADPTVKAQKELAALGIVIINQNVPAFHQLYDGLERSGGAAAKAANNYDGTVGSLQKMFTEAQKAGTVHTDMNFYQWATAAGILKDKLYDANGNFVGIRQTIQLLGQTIDNMNPEQKAQVLQQLFNVRGAQAAKLLLQDYSRTLDQLGNLDNIRKNTDAQQKAADVTNTLQGNMKRLGSTWQDTQARLGQVNLGPLQDVINKVSDMLHQFNTAPKPVRDFVGQLLVLATAATGLIFVVSMVVFAIGALGGVIGPVALAFAFIAQVVGWVIVYFTAFKTALEQNKGLSELFHNVLNILGGLLKNLGEQFQNLLKTMKLLEPVWNVLKVVLMVVAAILVGVILVAVGIIIGVFIALAWTVNLLIQVFSRVFSFIGTVIGNNVKLIKDFPKYFQAAWHGIQNAATQVWNNIKKGIEGFINGIKTTIQNGLNTVKQKFQEAIDKVVGLFSWLYNHNYYFQHLVDFINQKIADIRKKFDEIKLFITNLWTTLWGAVQAKVSEVWTNIINRFSQAKHDTTSKFDEIKLYIHNLWTILWNTVTNKVHEAWNNVTGALGNAKNMVTGKLNDIKNAILTPIQNLGQQLFDSAKHAVQMFIDGLGSMVGKVKDKAGEIAHGVTSFLGFHSPPKEGPLSDSDEYMPNMMRMFAGGIDAHKGLVGASAANVASHIGKTLGSINPTTGINATGSVMTNAMMQSLSVNQGSGMNQTLTIPVQIDGQTVSTVVLKQVGHQLTLNGVGRQLR